MIRATALLLALAALGTEAKATPAPALTVPCRDIIGQAQSARQDGYRPVLGVVSVPPSYLPQVVATHRRPWAYWRKAGLVVRANRAAVGVSVPRNWRTRAAITWGNGGAEPTVSALRIAACPSPPNAWNAYAGGFYLRARSACVPLIFRVGERRATVRFGVGTRCR